MGVRMGRYPDDANRASRARSSAASLSSSSGSRSRVPRTGGIGRSVDDDGSVMVGGLARVGASFFGGRGGGHFGTHGVGDDVHKVRDRDILFFVAGLQVAQGKDTLGLLVRP